MPLKTKPVKRLRWRFGNCSSVIQPLVVYGEIRALNSTTNIVATSIVERWGRTMKNIMWKYFTAKNTQKYIDVLPSMVEKYNNTYHRSIKLTPSDTRNPANYQHVHNALYARKATSPKVHVGDNLAVYVMER